MGPFVLRWLVLMLAIFVCTKLSFLGIHADDFQSLCVAALVLGFVNSFVRPLLVLFTLPFVFLSLGIFFFVINAFLFYSVQWIVKGFYVESFWSALGGSIVVSLVSLFLGRPGTKSKVRTQRGVPAPAQDPRTGPPPGKGPVIDI